VSIGVWSQASQSNGASASVVETVPQKQITKSDRRADRALKRSIYNALAKHTEIDAGNISIVAKNGVVTLDGTVTDASQIGAVENLVKSHPGVVAVTNKLMVQRKFEDD
jgi:osmotically-inducible protein OsmY